MEEHSLKSLVFWLVGAALAVLLVLGIVLLLLVNTASTLDTNHSQTQSRLGSIEQSLLNIEGDLNARR